MSKIISNLVLLSLLSLTAQHTQAEESSAEPVISYVSGSGPFPIGTREVEIVISTDVDASCKASKIDNDTPSNWKKYLTSSDNRTHSVRTPLLNDEDTFRYIRCRSLETQVVNTTSFAFPITFSNAQTVATPQNFVVDHANSIDGNFNLSWDAVSGISYYHLLEQNTQGVWQSVSLDAGALNINISRSEVGDYQYKIAACNDSALTDCSSFSDEIVVWVGMGNMGDAPVISYVSGSGPHPYGVDNIEMIVSTDINASCRGNHLDTGTFNDWNKLFTTDDNRLHRITVPISGAGDTEKYIRCQANESQETNLTSFVFPITVNAASSVGMPENFVADPVNNGGNYTLSWDPVSDAVTYLLKESTDGVNWERLVVDASQVSQSFSKTIDGNYQYYLFACSDELGLDCGKCAAKLTVYVNGGSSNNLAPTIVSSPLLSGAESVLYSYDVDATDPNAGDVLTYSLTNSPAGMTIISDSGIISWVPESAQVGSHSITVSVSDDAGLTDTQTFELVIDDINEAPTIISAAVTQATQGASYSYPVEATDPDAGDSLTYSLTVFPTGMTIDSLTGIIDWSPTHDQVSDHDVTIVVTDTAGLTATQIFVITVANVNDAPEFTSTPITTGQELVEYSYQLTASDKDNDSLTFDGVTLPDGMTISVDGLLLWTPSIGQEGAHDVSVSVTDPSLETTTQSFIIQVERRANTAPVADAQSLITNEDTALSIVLIATDVDNDVLTYEVVTNPTNGALTGTAPNLTYIPNANFFGSDSFTFKANDGVEDSNIAVIDISINSNNITPVITSNPSLLATVDHQYLYSLIATDEDGDSLTFEKNQGPVGLVVDNSSGLVSWTPNISDVGDQAVELQVTDSRGAITVQTFTIAVSFAANHAPKIISAPITSAEVNSNYSYAVLATDEDLDLLTYSLVSGPSGMSIGLMSGTISWTPLSTQIGLSQVIIMVEDGNGASTQQIFSVNTEIGQNIEPVITSEPPIEASVGRLLSYQILAEDGDGDVLEYELISAPGGVNIDNTTGLLSWVPVSNDLGINNIIVRAVDTKLAYAEQSFNIEVSPASNNVAPLITSTEVTSFLDDESYQYTVSATDENNDLLSYNLLFSPEGMTINPVTGAIAWASPEGVSQPITAPNDHCYEEFSAYDKLEVKTVWNRVVTTLTPAIAIRLVDTNEDGLVDSNDIPIVFAANNQQLLAMRTDNGDLVWPVLTASGLGVNQMSLTAVVAAADIDNDGLNEVITTVTKDGASNLIAFENDGTMKWLNTDIAIQSNADITFGDLENDGLIDIVVGDKIFNSQGILTLEAETSTSIDSQGILGQQGLILDLDLDGTKEILTGLHAYDNLGNEIWANRQLTFLNSGASFGVGNFDEDEFPEIIAVSAHHASLIEHDGTVTWGPIPIDIFTTTNIGGGGTPTIADFDNDGFDEAFVIGRSFGTLFDEDGEILWQVAMDDSSSSSVGATAFDLNHDGVLEIIFSDEVAFYIVNSLNGEILFSDDSHSSGTIQEHPIVGDFDQDGQVEILVTGYSGVTMYETDSESWGRAASLWNQSRFYPSAVDNSGLLTDNDQFWQSEGFKVNQPFTYKYADLAISQASYEHENQNLEIDVINRGLADASTTFVIKLYSDNPNEGGTFLSEIEIDELLQGESKSLSFINIDIATGTPLFLVIDEEQKLNECDLSNNTITAFPVSVQVKDPSGLSDAQTYLVSVKSSDSSPEIKSVSPESVVAGSLYKYPLEMESDFGDVHTLSLSDAPSNMFVKQVNQTIVWRTTNADVGLHSFTLTVTDSAGQSVSQNISLEVTESGNVAPVINDLILIPAIEEQLYTFTIIATDSDGDDTLITYELISQPQGMIVDSDSGLVQWTPSIDQIGENFFYLVARDELGLSTQIEVTIDVVEGSQNAPPLIESTPVFNSSINNNYVYSVIATDLDNDNLTYQLLTGPAGMNIDDFGTVTWAVLPADVGSHFVNILVFDSRGGSATQSYQLNVGASLQLPEILSTPELSVWQFELYQYTVYGYDPAGGGLEFSLESSPDGMTIDSITGLIQWTPSAVQKDIYTVKVVVTDINGVSDSQEFAVNVNYVSTNNAPQIHSEPPYSASLGILYEYQLDVSDEEQDPLSYRVLSGPDGFSISSQGLVNWTPLENQLGEIAVTLQVDDGANFVSQSYTLSVYEDPLLLDAQVSITPKVASIGEEVSIEVFSSGGTGQRITEIKVDGVQLALENNIAFFTPGEVRRYDVEVSVSDSVESKNIDTFFTVADVNDSIPPSITIHSPGNHAEITNSLDIVASIEDDNLADYFVALYDVADPIDLEYATVLASGTSSITNSTVAELDPSLIKNGLYHVVIQAEDLNGQLSVSSVTLRVTGDLKVGNFSITMEDKNVPLAGLPIRVTRTYDSRSKSEVLGFGYGWSVAYQDVELRESSEPTQGWEQFSSNSAFNIDGEVVNFPSTCTYPLSEKLVTVTLPNGDVETFSTIAHPVTGGVVSISDPNCTLVGGRYIDIIFDPRDGTDSELVSLDGKSLYLTNVAGGNLALDIIETEAFDVQKYQLTTRAGYIYKLDQYFGIETITDPNGNTITYSDDGIVHSSGKSVDFVRDSQGRITSITDPKGNVVSYDYNATGDLISSTDEVGNVTSYTYNSDHGLLDIIDPLGRTIVKNIYNDDGRLIAQEDNDGIRTNFVHDLAGRQSTVTDRLGRITNLYYDDEGNVTSQVDALNNVTTFTFDSEGNQLSKTDPLNRVTSATYNETDDQLTQTDALGEVVSFTYNDKGQELTVTDEKGNVFTNDYDAIGNLLSITDPQNNVVSNSINSQGLPLTVTDALNQVTSYTYDNEGNKLTETDPSGAVTSFTYDSNNNVLTQTLSRTLADNSVVDETVSYEYDSKDRIISTTDPLGNVTKTEFDLIGNEVAVVDAFNRRTEMEYDAYGRLVKTIYPDNSESSKTYDAEGNLLTETDRNGNTTSFEYDKLNRLIKTIYADTSETSTEYDAVGQVVAEIDANGNRTTHEYDLAGRRIKTTDALLNEHQFAYDESGNLVSETDALNRTTNYGYDSLDRKVSTTFANLSSVLTGFDALARRTSATDQANVTTSYAYDEVGRLVSVTDVENNVTSYTYDEAGNKLTQTDAEARTTSWTYDALGRVLTRTLPMGQVESFTYDVVGNMLTRTDFNGDVVTYTYDVNNRVTQIDYASDSTTDSFTYDDNGNRLTAINAEGTWTYTYDSMNRLKTETQPNGEVLSYEYDLAGNKTQLKVTYADASTRTEISTYDVLNRLATVTDADGNITSYEYDAVGNRVSVTHSNANVTAYVYDELNRLTQLQDKHADDTVFQQFDYELHATGRREKITELSGRVSDYTYDSLYRLTDEVITDAVNGDYSASYSFDKVGNRVASTINGVSTVYTYDDNDRLTQEGGEVYSYDDNGNTLSKTIDSDITTYTYDSRQKLIFADILEGGVSKTANYRYNVDGIRTQKVEDGAETNYLVDSNRDYAQVIAETDSANTVAVEYIFGDDLLAQNRSGNLSNYQYDGLGSTRALTDSTGNVSDEYFYDAFGVELARTGTTDNDYLFTGEQYDAGLGNYYLRARYYDQGIGRFTQQDVYLGRMNEPATLHKYLYTHADPVNGTDPSGYLLISEQMVKTQITGILTTLAVFNTVMSTNNNGYYVLTALPGGEKLDNLVKRKNKDDEEPTETLYHGTSSNRASKIVRLGFRGPDVFFAEDIATARVFGHEAAGRTGARSVTVIRFEIPISIATAAGIGPLSRERIGFDYGLGTPDIFGGTGFERVMRSMGQVLIFNGALIKKDIKATRLKM
jgi:RHS repeat-associated protein